MQTKLKLFTTTILTLSSLFFTQNIKAQSVESYFTPEKYHKKKAFDETFKLIEGAKEEVLITVYSWSLAQLKKSLMVALKNGAVVKMVINKGVDKKREKEIEELENFGDQYNGLEVKVAVKSMHEKFIIIDRKHVINTSANMSAGAKTRYAESFIFFKNYSQMVKSFLTEFRVLWNTSKDIFTRDEKAAEAMSFVKNNLPSYRKNLEFYSSSMNFLLTKSKSKKLTDIGRYMSMKRRANAEAWTIRDVIIKNIDQAKNSILCNFNHFFLQGINEALIRAVKRGVDVKLLVDNQEFKGPNGKEMTPKFVKTWREIHGKKKTPPVRVYFYSLYPNPRMWLLNHNKTIIIDYEIENPEEEQTVLITGSYNFSKTAEQGQFDNMVVFKGEQYRDVYKAYRNEFYFMWSLNRLKGDKIDWKKLKNFYTLKKGTLKIHNNIAQSLTWNEAEELKSRVYQVSKKTRLDKGIEERFYGASRLLNKRTSACHWYSPIKDKLLPQGCGRTFKTPKAKK